MRTLESFRANEMHRNCFAPYRGVYYKVEQLSNEYVTDALYLNWNNLKHLEQSTDVLYRGRNNTSSVIMWYISISHFTNELLELACIHTRKNFTIYASSGLTDKLKEIVTLLKLDTQGLAITDLLLKLEEYEALYNALTQQTKSQLPKMHHTYFSENAHLLNQADSLQAMLIAYEVFELFRNCIGGWDIMPIIDLAINGLRKSENLDVLILNVILPSAIDLLSKYQLTTKLNLSPIFQSYAQSPILPVDLVAMAQKIRQEPQFILTNAAGATDIINGHFMEYCKKYQ
ncbi:hypothetical protein HHL17_26225 [Chitinophaga sp. G-6-1-13]|uniref:Uncharacterized protein n=1 Tax=Chitinophaga fulva TaxID=2728842 RepID=A0A848GU96_9BACT|nr:hypothetical protein [Chitinophaga fulva]NML40722.1 hypothetical protein [Chitinophaga fulva]